jgi:hypothetical protein
MGDFSLCGGGLLAALCVGVTVSVEVAISEELRLSRGYYIFAPIIYLPLAQLIDFPSKSCGFCCLI